MLFSRNIEVKYDYDFVVCGGGMSGFAAALSAARTGLRVLLVEQNGCLGGTATSGGVSHLLGGAVCDENGNFVRSVGGIFDELSKRLIAENFAVDPVTINPKNNPHGWISALAPGVPFDGEGMKVILEEMCLEAGVKILYFTRIIDAECESGRIDKIILHNKSGLFAVSAKLFADTTGDADLAFLSGCQVLKGREKDGLMTPATLEMHVENVDREKLGAYIKDNKSPRFRELIKSLRDIGEWDFPFDIFISVQLVEKDVFMINTLRQTGIDGTDGESLTHGMIDGRAETAKLFSVMKKHFPGFENARLRLTAPVIGIRETRRISGEYMLTVDDLISGTVFEDTIAISAYGWDLPDPKLPSLQPMHGVGRKDNFTYIPYRSLLPKPISNLIVAGRCISAERDVLGPVRVMSPCMAMGEAAGYAAYLGLKNQNFKTIDTLVLRNMVRAGGGICYESDINK